MAIGEGLTAAKLAFEIGKTVADKLKNPSVDHQAVIAAVMTMQDHVLSAQAALNEAREENDNLRRQLAATDDAKALELDMEFVQDGAFYIRKSEQGKGLMNALCPVCWGESKKAMPMKPGESGSFHCIIHNSTYWTKAATEDYKRRQRESAERRRTGASVSTQWS